MKTVLWIDDSEEESANGEAILRSINGITPRVAASSEQAPHGRGACWTQLSLISCDAGQIGRYLMTMVTDSSLIT